MKKSFILWNGLLENLAKEDKLETIVLGTGSLAKEMQTKLRLFNIKTAPFLIGGVDDPKNGIKHYKSLENLNNPQNYRFICCYDINECKLIIPTYSIVYKLLGMASANHPRLLRFEADTVWSEYAGIYYIDTHLHESYVRGNHAYSVFGPENDKTAFQIHLLGRCTVSGNYNLNQYTLPELLQSKLYEKGFKSVVYAWGQPHYTIANSMLQLLRDAQYLKPNLVILFLTIEDFNSAVISKKNLITTLSGIRSQGLVKDIMYLYNGRVCNGNNHKIDIPSIILNQNRIFSTLSRVLDFSFWNVFSPSAELLLLEQSKQLLNLSEGHFFRAQKKRNEALDILKSFHIKDYTNTFDDTDDAFSVYADTLHFTDKGNEMVAERLMFDILKEFETKIL